MSPQSEFDAIRDAECVLEGAQMNAMQQLLWLAGLSIRERAGRLTIETEATVIPFLPNEVPPRAA